MINSGNAQKELAAIRALMSRAFNSADPQEWSMVVRNAMRRIDKVIERLQQEPAKIGRKGGAKTAERGPEYFRQIAAMRKTKSGGRPKKSP
jgi:hypothetical protein